jgi:hypothetical protein
LERSSESEITLQWWLWSTVKNSWYFSTGYRDWKHTTHPNIPQKFFWVQSLKLISFV